MFVKNSNLPRERARAEKKATAQGATDNQELVVSLMEENATLKAEAAKREQEITDLQAQMVSIAEGGVTNG